MSIDKINNMNLDLKETLLESVNENESRIANIIDKFDTLDILVKLIALNQLNGRKELFSGFNYSSIERYIIEYRSTFESPKPELISRKKLIEFIESFSVMKVQQNVIERLDKSNSKPFEYQSFVGFAQDVKGEAFPHQVFNQNYEILNSISESFKYHIKYSVISFFKFFTTAQQLYFSKFLAFYDNNDIDKLSSKKDLVDAVFKNKLYENLFISIEDFSSHKLEGENKLSDNEIKYYLTWYSRSFISDEYKEYTGVESYPIISINDKYLILHHHYFTWNQTNKAVELVKTNQKLFKKYNKARSQWLENKTFSHLNNVFSSEYIVKNAKYYYEGELHESDILIDYHDTLIIVECKSHHITKPSKTGNLKKFEKDVKKILGDAFEQADKLRKFIAKELLINDFNVYDKTGKHIVHKVKKGSPERILLLSITLDNLKSLGTMLSKFHQEGVYKQGIDIVSYNVHDLEFICDFLNKPYLFIDYTIKRIEKVKKYHVVDELDYLGWYHDTLLNMNLDDKFSGIYMTEDYIPYFERYLFGKEEKLELIIKKDWLDLLNKLSEMKYSNKLLLESVLLNMKENAYLKLLEQIEVFRQDVLIQNGEKAKTFTFFPEDDTDPNIVVTFIYTSKKNYNKSIVSRIKMKVRDRFIKSRKKHWFTIVLQSKDVEVKEVQYKSSNVLVKVGRNQPCPCGSGLKYKKCCLK